MLLITAQSRCPAHQLTVVRLVNKAVLVRLAKVCLVCPRLMVLLAPRLKALRQFLLDNKIMLTIIRKIIFHLVAIALRAWQTELINRLDKGLDGKEENNEESSKTAEKSK